MKHYITLCYAVVFLLLFSCSDDGGQLPEDPQKSRSFVDPEEAFKKFLAARGSNFSSLNSGFNFVGNGNVNGNSCDEPAITLTGFGGINGPFTSEGCYYYTDGTFEVFYIVSSAPLSDRLRLYLFVDFYNMGIPESGNYYEVFDCWEYCTRNMYVGAQVADSDSHEVYENYYTDSPSVNVINDDGKISVSSIEPFRFYNYYYENSQFTAEGTMSCCN